MPGGFDWPGAALSSASLVSFLLAMTNGYRLGWASSPVVGGLVAATLLMALFLWWETRAEAPMLDLRFFRSKVFSMGVSARFLSFLAGSSIFFLMPFYLIVVLGHEASRAGLMMVPGSLAMAVMGPVSGRLADRFGTRWLAVIGMALSATAMLMFARLSVDSSWVHVVAGMVLSGSGMGIFSSSNTTAVMASIDRERYGIVSAFSESDEDLRERDRRSTRHDARHAGDGVPGYEPTLAAVTGSGDGGVERAFVLGLTRAYLTGAAFVLIGMALSAFRGEARALVSGPGRPSSP